MRQLLSVGSRLKQAFTIVEVMTVVVIAGLLLTTAIPGYENMMRNVESSVMAYRLASSLNLAKAEAIKQGIPVTVCPITGFNATTSTMSSDQTSEQWPCQSSTTWDAWKVFDDPKFNAVENYSAGSPAIQYVGNNQPGSITSNVSGPITFDPMGFANINPSSTRSGWTWSSSYTSGEWSWSYAYSSAYSGAYSRIFTIAPAGCTGQNAITITITQNGVISTESASC